MPVIQLDLPPDLDQFVRDQARTAGHVEVDAFVIAVLRRLQDSKAKAEIEVKLSAAIEQLDRGEGRSLTPLDWQNMREDHCRRHGIQDES